MLINDVLSDTSEPTREDLSLCQLLPELPAGTALCTCIFHTRINIFLKHKEMPVNLLKMVVTYEARLRC